MTSHQLQQLHQLALNYSLHHRHEAALAVYEQIISFNPHDSATLLNIGSTLIQLGRFHQAITTLNQVTQLLPNHHLAFTELGHAHTSLGQFQLGINSFLRAIKLRPNDSSLYYHLGNTYQLMHRYQPSIRAYQKSLFLHPQSAPVLNNLGNVYRLIGQTDLAYYHYKQALQTDPHYANTHNNLGILSELKHDLPQALKHYRTASHLDPKHYVAISNSAGIYIKLNRFYLAKKALKQALAINPQHTLSYFRLGLIQQHLHQYLAAKRNFDLCLHLDPSFTTTYSYAYYASLVACDWRHLESYRQQINAASSSLPIFSEPFVDLFIHQSSKQNFKSASTYSLAIEKDTAQISAPPLSTPTHRRSFLPINLGYISQSFHNHPISHMFQTLLQLHNHHHFNVHVFSYGPNDGSNYYKSVQHHADTFTNLTNLSHHQSVSAIQNKNIDILIDIACYTTSARPQIPALHPAPIQISYLAFPGTTGARFFDYLIADPFLIPPPDRRFYSEKILYLPHTYQLTHPTHPISSKAFSRADFELPPKGTVFSVFNQYTKIEPQVFTSWMHILKHVPNSVLWFIDQGKTGARNLHHQAHLSRIHPSRLIFSPSLPKNHHLNRHRLADIALDTFIYNGHTTSTDALLSDVPVVTLKGSHFASRVAASLLTALGLPELITHNRNDYQQLAIHLATHPHKLKQLKSKIKNHQSHYPYFNPTRFVKNLESTYQTIWSNYQNGNKPRVFSIPDPQPLILHQKAPDVN